jgi:hypothetical protein
MVDGTGWSGGLTLIFVAPLTDFSQPDDMADAEWYKNWRG